MSPAIGLVCCNFVKFCMSESLTQLRDAGRGSVLLADHFKPVSFHPVPGSKFSGRVLIDVSVF